MAFRILPMSAALVAAALSGCVQHTWAPGPGQSAENFGRTNGQCKLAAMGVNSGGGAVYAQGSPQFVGAYTGAVVLAGAIAGAVRQNEAYNDCMEASGFVPADMSQPVSATTGNPACPKQVQVGDHFECRQ